MQAIGGVAKKQLTGIAMVRGSFRRATAAALFWSDPQPRTHGDLQRPPAQTGSCRDYCNTSYTRTCKYKCTLVARSSAGCQATLRRV